MLPVTAPQWQSGQLMALPDLLLTVAQESIPTFLVTLDKCVLLQELRLTYSVQGVGASGSDLGTRAPTQPPEPDGPAGCPLSGHKSATAEEKSQEMRDM